MMLKRKSNTNKKAEYQTESDTKSNEQVKVEEQKVQEIEKRRPIKDKGDSEHVISSVNEKHSLSSGNGEESSVKDVRAPLLTKIRQKKLNKLHLTVNNGGQEIIVNYVWINPDPLGALEKFNIYSWRALGHKVNIYTHPTLSHEELGIEPIDATIIPLRSKLDEDEAVDVEGDPRHILKDGRSILSRWIDAIPEQGITREHIFNIVDLTKSYLGGTKRGIVLDMKVGPSVHLQDYAASFNDQLISYTRGGNTPELPENQSIGTMQKSDSLRVEYALAFNERIKNLADADFNKPWFNHITGYHGQSYQQSNWLDVATKKPDGQINKDDYKVSEPGEFGKGPFRIYKAASDQTNKPNSVKTKPQDVLDISIEALNEMMQSGGDQYFIEKAIMAHSKLPKPAPLW
ncbi:hypothetical protein [Pleionea sediminis]|uniref:hypothetical protein n=1 Tax=Pleionea sediminis TaxID=2569479 RepID=UPI001184CDA2|nr:hypothetical protein [Pleionea sediminis]